MQQANKVTIQLPTGEEIVLDLTSDTVSPDTLAEGVTAHDATGKIITGTMPTNVIPTYHYTECARVLENIENFKSAHPNHLIFGAVSDIHVNNTNADTEAKTKASIKYASFALETVGAMGECDFIANLGDLCEEQHIDTDPTYIAQYGASGLVNAKYAINAMKPAFTRLRGYGLVGNHDKSKDTQALFDLIGSGNDYDAFGTTQIRGFGYKDFTEKKVRLIVVNTFDYLYDASGCGLSYDQKDFLMRALDLSAKSDCAEWQILLLSHIPLDWNGGDYNYYADLQAILTAYENGTTASITVNLSYAVNERDAVSTYATYSSGKLVYNYSGKNSAKIIANIHGHIHNNKVGKIANTSIARISTGNANYANSADKYASYGDYVISASDFSALTKQFGTVKDTSATFYCIDLNEQTVYAYGYGADVDRTIVYKTATIYTIEYNLTLCSVPNAATEIAEGSSYTTTITPTDANGVIKSVKVTMGGTDITSTAYADGVINIANVTGNISITAICEMPLITETITPHIAPRSTWFNGLQNDGTLVLNPSNAEGALGVTTANSYSYTDRAGKTFYLMPVDSKYCKATLNYSATDGLAVTYYMRALKDNGGKFTAIATVGKGTNNVITWEKGEADYLIISIEHADGATKWDWNSAGKTITVTFSNQ